MRSTRPTWLILTLLAAAPLSANAGDYLPAEPQYRELIALRLAPEILTDDVARKMAAAQIRQDRGKLKGIESAKRAIDEGRIRPDRQARTLARIEQARAELYFREDQLLEGDIDVLADRLKDELRRRILGVARKMPTRFVSRLALSEWSWHYTAEGLSLDGAPDHLIDLTGFNFGPVKMDRGYPYIDYELLSGDHTIDGHISFEETYDGPPVWKSSDVPQGQKSVHVWQHLNVRGIAIDKLLALPAVPPSAALKRQISPGAGNQNGRASEFGSVARGSLPSLRFRGEFVSVVYHPDRPTEPRLHAKLHDITLVGDNGKELHRFDLSRLRSAADRLAELESQWAQEEAEKHREAAARRDAEAARKAAEARQAIENKKRTAEMQRESARRDQATRKRQAEALDQRMAALAANTERIAARAQMDSQSRAEDGFDQREIARPCQKIARDASRQSSLSKMNREQMGALQQSCRGTPSPAECIGQVRQHFVAPNKPVAPADIQQCIARATAFKTECQSQLGSPADFADSAYREAVKNCLEPKMSDLRAEALAEQRQDAVAQSLASACYLASHIKLSGDEPEPYDMQAAQAAMQRCQKGPSPAECMTKANEELMARAQRTPPDPAAVAEKAKACVKQRQARLKPCERQTLPGGSGADRPYGNDAHGQAILACLTSD